MQLKYQLFRNSASTLVQLFVGTVVGLIVPPVLIKYLGFDTYGIWALLIVVNTYAALLDLGFGSSLIKYIAEAHALGNTGRIVHLMNVSLTTYLAVYVVSLSLLFLFGKTLMHALLGASAQRGDFLFIFNAYAVVALTALMTVPFSSLLRGLQRYDQSNMIEMVAALVSAVSTVVLLVRGWKLEALVAGAGLALALRLVAYMGLTRRTYHLFKMRWEGLHRLKLTLGELFRLSPADQSVRVYGAIAQTIIRVSINVYAGVAYVGIYDVAKRVVSQVSGVSTVVFVPLMPAVAALSAQKQHAKLRELLRRCYLYLCMAGLPIVFFMLCFYDPVLRAWLKVTDVGMISFAGRLLLLAIVIDIFTGPVTTSALGLGTANLHLLKMTLTTVLIVALVWLLGSRFGFKGVIVAEFCAVTCGALAGLAIFQNWFAIPVGRMIVSSLWRTSLVGVPVWLVLSAIWWWSSDSGVWRNLAAWALMLVVGTLMTLGLYWLSGLVSSYEVRIAQNALFPSRIVNRLNEGSVNS